MDSVRHNHSDDASDLLSAYVDGVVDNAERRRAEALAVDCPACARDVHELRALKRMLRDLPTARPVRSFTLDPATAPRPRALLFPTLRLATLLSVVLLFVVLGVDALGGGPAATGGGAAAALPAGETGAAADSAAAMAEESQQMPMAAPGDEFGTMAASAAASQEASSDQPAASAESSMATAAASVAAGVVTPPRASTGAAASAAAPAGANTQSNGESAVQPGAEASAPAADALAPSAAAPAPEAASQAPAASVAPASGGGAGGTETLQLDRSTGPNTAEVAIEPAASGSFDTLRIAQIVLALVALSLGLGALWAWRTGR